MPSLTSETVAQVICAPGDPLEGLVRLTPSEQDRLLLFSAAELARRRHARGVLLNAPEAIAIIADTVAEVARDGGRHATAVQAGRDVLSVADVLPGVPELVGDVSVEAVFEDGTRLVVVSNPLVGDVPEPTAKDLARLSAREAAQLAPGTVLPGDATRAPQDVDVARLTVENTAEIAITVTSHFHFFEVNRRLSFDRRSAYGRHLAIGAGEAVRFEPGASRYVELVRIGGQRLAVGFSGLVDGPLDAAGALESALQRGRDAGFLGCGEFPDGGA